MAPRSGTLLSTRAVNGQPTIYVVGTDGELHGFSTSAQFVRDGYDAALVVTTPNLGGLSHGSAAGVAGPAVNALATRADGGIVDAAGTFYVFAAGRADGISTPGELVRIRKADAATVVHGPVGSAQTRAAIASGVLFSARGKVYVSYEGDLYPFETKAQLATDGYGGTAAVPVAGTGALTVVPPARNYSDFKTINSRSSRCGHDGARPPRWLRKGASSLEGFIGIWPSSEPEFDRNSRYSEPQFRVFGGQRDPLKVTIKPIAPPDQPHPTSPTAGRSVRYPRGGNHEFDDKAAPPAPCKAISAPGVGHTRGPGAFTGPGSPECPVLACPCGDFPHAGHVGHWFRDHWRGGCR